jgi:DNA repair photolyase
VTYTDGGFWLHTGGIYGRELRNEPIFQISTKEDRVRRTINRLATIRSKNQLIIGD